MRKTRAQKIRQPRVFFQRQHTRSFVQYQFRQCAETWSDFDYIILSSQIGLIDDPPREILIVQKILS